MEITCRRCDGASLLPFVLPIAIWVAWSDMKRMKIPNKAVLAMAAIWPLPGLAGLAPGSNG
jgi:prepilin peptidase CpaA